MAIEHRSTLDLPTGRLSPLEAAVLTQVFFLSRSYANSAEHQKSPSIFLRYFGLLRDHGALPAVLDKAREFRAQAFSPMSDAQFAAYARKHAQRYAHT